MEYGLTDIQEYYANTGAMVRAMDDIQGGTGKVLHFLLCGSFRFTTSPCEVISIRYITSSGVQHIIRYSNYSGLVILVLN